MIEIPIVAYNTMVVVDTIIFLIFINIVVVKVISWAKEKIAKFKRRRYEEDGG